MREDKEETEEKETKEANESNESNEEPKEAKEEKEEEKEKEEDEQGTINHLALQIIERQEGSNENDDNTIDMDVEHSQNTIPNFNRSTAGIQFFILSFDYSNN